MTWIIILINLTNYKAYTKPHINNAKTTNNRIKVLTKPLKTIK